MSAGVPDHNGTITPLMFPSGTWRLMGVHYAPSLQTRRGVGALMCNQVGPDYAEYYKTVRVLVGMLVAKGFDCLRFDYTGGGDSQGSCEDGSVRQWLADIASAEALLSKRSGCSKICLCGFGFGGLLAAAHAAGCEAEALVLWESVVDGRSYCRTLRENHSAWLRGSFVKATKLDKKLQAMGFVASADLERQMRQWRLTDLPLCRAHRVFAVVQDGSSDQAVIVEHLRRAGISVETCAPGDALPLRPMRAAIAWLERIAGDG
jgi:pimeloyl-ACP methyl ester carboxylesterase